MVSDLHTVPHREINMLLEVLRERGFVYDKANPIFSALKKLMKHSFGRQFRPVELNKTLQLTKALKNSSDLFRILQSLPDLSRLRPSSPRRPPQGYPTLS